MADAIIQNGLKVRVNDQDEQLERMRGLGLTGDLVAGEAASWRRFLPGKLPVARAAPLRGGDWAPRGAPPRAPRRARGAERAPPGRAQPGRAGARRLGAGRASGAAARAAQRS